MADGSIRIDTRINKKGAERGLEELKKVADTKVKQLEKGVANSGKEIDKLNNKIATTEDKLADVNSRMDEIASEIYKSAQEFEGIGTANLDEFVQKQIDANAEYQKLGQQQDNLIKQVLEYKNELSEVKSKFSEINSSLAVAQKEQSSVNLKLEDAKQKAEEYKNKIKDSTKHTKKVSVESLGISKNLGGAVKKLAKYGLALLGFQQIYGLLRSSMNEWLNGSSKEVKQLNADISNIKGNIASMLAPVLNSVLQIFYKILGVVGAVVRAFSNINIFAKNTAKSTKSSASSTKQMSNNLASFDNLDVLSKDDNSGGGAADVLPTDLSSVMAQYEDLANKIKEIFDFIFEPFRKAWETTGQSVIDAFYNALDGIKNLCIAVGSSFRKIWTNGTVQTTAELLLKILADILNIIGNIANAFAKAWTEGGKGDAIIQSLANAFNNVLAIAESVLSTFAKWWKSEKGQQFADSCVSIFKTISGWIEKLTEKLKEIWDNGGQHAFESLLDVCSNVLKIIEEILDIITPILATFLDLVAADFSLLLDSIGNIFDGLNDWFDAINNVDGGLTALAIVVSGFALAIVAYNVVQALANGSLGIWNTMVTIATSLTSAFTAVIGFLTSPITLVILAITALIAIIVLLIENWDIVSIALSEGWEWLKNKAIEVFTAIKDFLSNTWNNIKSTALTLWNHIKMKILEIIENLKINTIEKITYLKNMIVNIFEILKKIVVNIWDIIKTKTSNIVNDIYSNVLMAFTNLKNAVSSIFETIKTIVSNVWDNIWSKTKTVANSILGGIERLVNGVIDGLNNMINALNSLRFDVPDWVPMIGGKSFGLSISNIGNVSLPRLAKGGIVNQPTRAIIGEAGREAILPLENNTEWMEILAEKIASRINVSKDEVKTIILQFEGELAQLARLLKPILDEESKRQGYDLVVSGGNT